MRVGIAVFGIASIAAGVLDLVWGEFESAHQPIQAWGDHIPGVTIFAYIAALWLIAAGAALLWPRSAWLGAAALAVLYGIFILFPLPRLYTARISSDIGSVPTSVSSPTSASRSSCTLQPWSPGSRCLHEVLFRRELLSDCRWTFGLCSLFFGLGHLTAVRTVVPMISKWMPRSGLLGKNHRHRFRLAGLAILSGVMDVLAARLLALMLLVFSALSLAPLIFASPHNHVAWGGNAYNWAASAPR